MSGLLAHRGLLLGGAPPENLGTPLAEYRFNNNLDNTGSGGVMFTGSPLFSSATKVEGSHSHSQYYLTWSGGLTSFLSPALFVFEFWIKVNAYPAPGSYYGVASRRSGYSSQAFTLLFNGDNDSLVLEFRTSGVGAPTNTLSIARSLFPVGEWRHFRLSRAADGVLRMFVSGVAQASVATDPISTGSSGAAVACGSNALTSLSANYDLLRYYDNVGVSDNFTPPTT